MFVSLSGTDNETNKQAFQMNSASLNAKGLRLTLCGKVTLFQGNYWDNYNPETKRRKQLFNFFHDYLGR